jgi:hypothetical protein
LEVFSVYLRILAAGLVATAISVIPGTSFASSPGAVPSTIKPLSSISVPAASSAASLSMATFEGHTIDLRHGWGAAKACLDWRANGILECFTSRTALEQREAQLAPERAAFDHEAGPDLAAVPTCSSGLNLYSAPDFGGLWLSLWDEGFWQELYYDGFAGLTASFIGGECGFHLADGGWGSGWWYPGYTGPWAFAYDMGSWDYTVQSVYID